MRVRAGCIGKKGIGWKSTFTVSQCPHVLSGDFTFKFDVDGPLGKLAYVTPTWLTDAELEKLPQPVQDAHRNGGTVIYLPLRGGSNGIVEAFDRLCQHNVTLLFLKKLRHVRLGYPCGKTAYLQQCNSEELGTFVRVALSSAGGRSEESQDEAEIFQYMLHAFEVERVEGRSLTLRLAFPSAETQTAERMAVHVGLPVRSVGFHFAIDAPFDLVASRADLHEGLPAVV